MKVCFLFGEFLCPNHHAYLRFCCYFSCRQWTGKNTKRSLHKFRCWQQANILGQNSLSQWNQKQDPRLNDIEEIMTIRKSDWAKHWKSVMHVTSTTFTNTINPIVICSLFASWPTRNANRLAACNGAPLFAFYTFLIGPYSSLSSLWGWRGL